MNYNMNAPGTLEPFAIAPLHGDQHPFKKKRQQCQEREREEEKQRQQQQKEDEKEEEEDEKEKLNVEEQAALPKPPLTYSTKK